MEKRYDAMSLFAMGTSLAGGGAEKRQEEI
jgi:hypothetical protein